MIRKTRQGYKVTSTLGKSLGTYPSKPKAVQRLKQFEKRIYLNKMENNK